MQEYAKGLRNMPVPERMSVEEAAALFEVWLKDRALYGGECDIPFCKLRSRKLMTLG